MADQFLLTLTEAPPGGENLTNYVTQTDQSELSVDRYRYVKYISYSVIMPAILAVGILGNIINITILCKQRLQRSMDKMERCATMGFIFLSVSDLAYCLCGFISVFVNSRTYAVSGDVKQVFDLIYTLYRDAILNTILISSTWCVVVIAIERYLVVTHAMKARSSVRLKRTVILQVIIPLASVLLNVPSFCKYTFYWSRVDNSTTMMVPWPSTLSSLTWFRNTYSVLITVISTVVPVIILIYCNIQLILAIIRSRSLVNKTSRVTLILVSIIVLYIVLVCPSAVMTVIQEIYISQPHHNKSYTFLTAVVITNVMQSINFAINFFLYFGMNPKFRSNLRCQSCGRASDHLKNRIKQYDLVRLRSKCAEVSL